MDRRHLEELASLVAEARASKSGVRFEFQAAAQAGCAMLEAFSVAQGKGERLYRAIARLLQNRE